MRRVQEYGLFDLQEFSNISDDRIDNITEDFISRHGSTTGEPFMSGNFHSSNQRIQRLWRVISRCVCHFFYFTFYAMKQSRILDVKNLIHIFSLHLVFTSRINTSLTEFANMLNNHRLSTEHGWTPNQIWLNGILNENNPLSSSGGVDESKVDEFYGEDPEPHTLIQLMMIEL